MNSAAAALLCAILLAPGSLGCLIDDELEIGSESSEVSTHNRMTYNRMTYNRMTYNRMTYNSLATNQISSAAIVDQPLTSETYTGSRWPQPYLRQQLLDQGAQEFMTYLVSCALDETQEVQWLSPDRSRRITFEGGLGLCTEWGEADGRADTTCQELVSACLLARNNAFGTKVAISLRGLDSKGRPLVDPDRAQDVAFDREVDSYRGCEGGETGPSRNCGWITDYVGTCDPDEPVWLHDGQCWGDMTMRVCSGRSGCDHQGQGWLGSRTHACDTGYLYFRCPESGTFSVMKAPHDSASFGYMRVAAYPWGNVKYPATELDVFPEREGAFFGNIFDNNFNQRITVSTSSRGVTTYRYGSEVYYDVQEIAERQQGTVYPNMYSCFSDEWRRPEAYMRERICASVDNDACAARVVGACRYHPGTSSRYRCGVNDNSVLPGDEDYDRCSKDYYYGSDRGRVWDNPITVHLDDLCDLQGPNCPY